MTTPEGKRLRWLVKTCARLVVRGAEPSSGLVLPNARFFPDRFDGSREAVEHLMARVLDYAGLGDAKTELQITGAHGQAGRSSHGGCASGGGALSAVPRVRRAASGKGYVISVDAAEMSQPIVLATGLARASSAVFLSEANLWGEFEPHEREGVVDVAAVLLGFGVLLSNGSYLYSKGCGGAKVGSATALPVEEVTTVLAIFCQWFHVPSRQARAELDQDAGAYFAEAWRWARANAATIELVRNNPEVIDADGYRLVEGRSWLSRLLGMDGSSSLSAPPVEECETLPRSPKRDEKSWARRRPRASRG